MERKHWIRIVAFCLVAFLLYRGAAWFLQVPSARNNVRVFAMEQEPENTLDVVLIGSSNVYTSWYAPLAYEQQGFTSYALATDSMPGVVIRSAIREVERLQDPQAIVIDLWCFAYTEEEMLDACRKAHILDFIQRQPQGLDTLVGNRGLKLSRVEKQRISIARVLLKDPALLIFDEATSALDSISEAKIQEAIEPIIQQRTSILIAHRLSTILAADEILVVKDGRIVERGVHSELVKAGGTYTELYETQFKKALEKAE